MDWFLYNKDIRHERVKQNDLVRYEFRMYVHRDNKPRVFME